MSAFRPYRAHQPVKLESMVQVYGVFQVKMPPVSAKEDKGSKFLIKNILGSEEETKKEEKKVLSVEEEASKLEVLVSCLGKTEIGHRCIYCGKIYSRKYGLKIHIRTHTGYKPLQCKFCLRPFGDPSNLNKHVRLHASEASSPYRCLDCGKIMVRKRDLDRHVQARHAAGKASDGTSIISSGGRKYTKKECSDDKKGVVS